MWIPENSLWISNVLWNPESWGGWKNSKKKFVTWTIETLKYQKNYFTAARFNLLPKE